MFLAQALSADRSCQRAVNEGAIKRLIAGLTPCSSHTGAYCRARQRVLTSMVSTLVKQTAKVKGATFNAVENPGPLASFPGNPAANFFGGKFNQTVLTDDLVLYRGGEASKPLGRWFTRERLRRILCLAR